MYIVVTLLLGFAAVNTGNNLIFLIVAALLAFMSVSGVLGWLNIRGMSVRADLPDEVYCGHETLVTVRLGNGKRCFPSFLLKAEVLGETVDFDLLGRGEEGRNSFMFRFMERGEHSIAAGKIFSPFPINFFIRSRTVPLNRTVTVFPAPLPSPLPAGSGGKELSGSMAACGKGYEGEMAKVVDYSGAEPLKLVHWRLSAKHEELKVKEFASTTREPVILDIAAIPASTLEEKLSRAVFLVNRLIKTERPVGLKLGERLIQPAATRDHRLRLLKELACHGKD